MSVKSLLVKQYTDKHLTLNESISNKGKYILEGVFGVVSDTPNNNGRIYTEEEYLPQIKLIREELKQNMAILGEIDHPEDRFEVRLKEASHRILDVWYDKINKVIMGKIELLNTPNGNILKSLVEQNIPLFISSRAAGTVGNDNKVNIKRIFTWDVVYRPGFKECKLSLVNESMRGYVDEFLTSSLNRVTRKDISSKFNLINENVKIYEMDEMPNLKYKMNYEINELTDPLYEENDVSDYAIADNVDILPQVDNATEAKKVGLPNEASDATERLERERDNNKLILDVTAIMADETEDTEDHDTEKEDTEDKEDSIEVDNDLIISVTPVKEKKEKKKKLTRQEEREEKEEKEDSLLDKRSTNSIEAEGDAIDAKIDKGSTNKYTDLINKHKKEKKEDESIKESYEIAKHLDIINYETFKALDDASRKELVSFISESINDYADMPINEAFTVAQKDLRVKKLTVEPYWLSNASPSYKNAYNALNKHGREKIDYLANLMVFENKRDVNEFWTNTGIIKTMEQINENANVMDAKRISENDEFSNYMKSVTVAEDDGYINPIEMQSIFESLEDRMNKDYKL